MLAEVALPVDPVPAGAYRTHPALLDACFQSVGAGVQAGITGGLLLLLGARSLRLRAYPQCPLLLHAVDQGLQRRGPEVVRPTSTC